MGGRRLIGRAAALLVYILLVPGGIVLRLARDPLRTRRPPRATNWRTVRSRAPTLERARRLE